MSLAGGGNLHRGIVLAVMILPIITSVTRGCSASPPGQVEAAQALGATKWGHPHDGVPLRSRGMIAGSCSVWVEPRRETVAVLIILQGIPRREWSLFDGVTPSPPKIASAAANSAPSYRPGPILPRLWVLFILTFIVNALARVAAGGKG